MIRTLSILALSAMMWGCGARTGIDWFQGPFASAQATAGDNMIMLDFYTEW
ncbi:MAG: hypothetical protein IIA60_10400 [Candidatus Marinimicrobia bacterium]|nr:hypothetical protein [Candidatus Neomarinimicrobiota bacterium]